jgi:hypothetical protein
VPLNYIELISNCKYFNFYYSEVERNSYLNIWRNKLDNVFIPYSIDEYNFYVNLCLENQYINDIQIEHYIDNGCFCKACIDKRRNIFFRAKKGEINFEKIIHSEAVKQEIKNINKKIIKTIKNKTQELDAGKKFVKNQFKIQLKPK